MSTMSDLVRTESFETTSTVPSSLLRRTLSKKVAKSVIGVLRRTVPLVTSRTRSWTVTSKTRMPLED
ncbi:hypothetical protein P8C59_003796 [Phyllachora maydis]|uniref:Uncharacterized protein n=1 Tax=Phyllachora maydis TaxID=1825666 RepID=A0AAD9I1F3_9PEZI|nr:hypothetical protein P8C59_003796 [Phyllachora maydis]